MEFLLVTNNFFSLPESLNLFSLGHIFQIIVTFAVLTASFFIFRNKRSWATPFFIILSVLSNAIMLCMFLYSLKTNIYNPEWYFPAHICNLFMLIFPVMAIFKKKVRTFLYDYTFYFGILGCLFAIVMPSTTQLYFAPFSFLSVFTWAYHILIGLAGVYIFSSGLYTPKVSTFWRLVAVFFPLSLIAMYFNYIWDTNFIFLNTSKMYYPLNLFAGILSDKFVFIIAGMIVVMPVFLFFASLYVDKIKDKLVIRIIKSSYFYEFAQKTKMFQAFKNSNFINFLKQNEQISKFFDNLSKNIDYNALKQCYNEVEEDLKNLTVAQLEDMNYIYGLIKKSKIIAEVIKNLKLAKLRILTKILKNAPLKDLFKMTQTYFGQFKDEQAEHYLAYSN